MGLVNLKSAYIEGKKQIHLTCENKHIVKAIIKTLKDAQWNEEFQCYIVENNIDAISSIFRASHRKAWVSIDGLLED